MGGPEPDDAKILRLNIWAKGTEGKPVWEQRGEHETRDLETTLWGVLKAGERAECLLALQPVAWHQA